jgi:hypothetical protein
MPSWDDLPEGPDRRFYLASILGADYGTLSVGNGPNATDPLFTTGAAAGIAFERPQGWFRTEFEARYRDPVSSTVGDPTLGGSASVTARDGWSTMINAWRDRSQHGHEIDGQKPVGDSQHAHIGLPQAVGEFVGLEAGIDRNGHGAKCARRQKQCAPLARIAHTDREVVAPPKPQAL